MFLEDIAHVCGLSHEKFSKLYAGIRKDLGTLVYTYQANSKVRKIMIDSFLIENCISKDL